MKKHLLIAFAICVLFLSACGSLVEKSTPSTSPATHSAAPIATASAQSVCQVMHDRQAQLIQEYTQQALSLPRLRLGGTCNK